MTETMVTEAVVIGGAVWAVIGGLWCAWLLATAWWRPLPHAGDALRWLVGSWLGRAVALAVWAEAGWHVFCQRP